MADGPPTGSGSRAPHAGQGCPNALCCDDGPSAESSVLVGWSAGRTGRLVGEGQSRGRLPRRPGGCRVPYRYADVGHSMDGEPVVAAPSEVTRRSGTRPRHPAAREPTPQPRPDRLVPQRGTSGEDHRSRVPLGPSDWAGSGGVARSRFRGASHSHRPPLHCPSSPRVTVVIAAAWCPCSQNAATPGRTETYRDVLTSPSLWL